MKKNVTQSHIRELQGSNRRQTRQQSRLFTQFIRKCLNSFQYLRERLQIDYEYKFYEFIKARFWGQLEEFGIKKKKT